MDDITNMDEKEVVKELFFEGHKLTIFTYYEQDFGWSLSVESEKGVTTNWDDFFPGPEEAIDTALKAINKEGIDEFLGYDDFGYLYEDRNT